MLVTNDISAGKAYTYGTGIFTTSYRKLLIFWGISMIPAGASETTPRHTYERWQK